MLAQTLVKDNLLDAGGHPLSGQARITWSAFSTTSSQFVSAGSTNVSINSGNLQVWLYPTVGSTPTTLYSVTLVLNGATTYQYWNVPTSTTPVSISQVVTGGPTRPTVGIITNVAPPFVVSSSGMLAAPPASGSSDGYLSRSDWARFNWSAGGLLVGTPASSTDPCTPPQLEYNGVYIYVCVATNTWRRFAPSLEVF